MAARKGESAKGMDMTLHQRQLQTTPRTPHHLQSLLARSAVAPFSSLGVRDTRDIAGGPVDEATGVNSVRNVQCGVNDWALQVVTRQA